MEVIAEGIETEDQYNHLRVLGCEYGQGYLFSPPVSTDRAWDLLEEDAAGNGEFTFDLEQEIKEVVYSM